MYPRNAASPPRIAIGAVVQIADGAVQSSGVSVVVRPEGGAESAGSGTIAYSAASGLVYYTPTQAETDYTAFCVIAYKASCLPVSQTVVTTASSTAGAVELDSAAILAVADQVWDEATSGHTTAGTYGGRVVRATNSNTEVQITASNHIAADVHDVRPNGLSGSTEITNIENASGYMLAVLAGACADPQTASETYAITVFGSTFTVDMAGQTSTGTRTAPTLTKV